MRLVKVKAPAGKGVEVAEIAFAVGIKEVAIYQEQIHHANQQTEVKDSIDIETSTPLAKQFMDALTNATFFEPGQFAINLREPRSIISAEELGPLTKPIIIPTVEILEQLWQFSYITFSFILRILIAGLLLAYGMLHDNLLLMIGGLLFLPLLPVFLSISFGAWTRQWQLVGQGLLAAGCALLLIILSGMLIATLTSSPMQFQQFSSPLPSFLISLGVGIAAGLATADDVGRRELIGLAATAQTALLPAWFGIALVRGFAATTPTGTPTHRMLTFGANLVIILLASGLVYALLGMRRHSMARR